MKIPTTKEFFRDLRPAVAAKAEAECQKVAKSVLKEVVRNLNAGHQVTYLRPYTDRVIEIVGEKLKPYGWNYVYQSSGTIHVEDEEPPEMP